MATVPAASEGRDPTECAATPVSRARAGPGQQERDDGVGVFEQRLQRYCQLPGRRRRACFSAAVTGPGRNRPRP